MEAIVVGKMTAKAARVGLTLLPAARVPVDRLVQTAPVRSAPFT